MHAVITGASGFVGRVLGAALPEAVALPLSGHDWQARIDAAPLREATVFHLAARVHRPGDGDDDAYRHDNVEKTRALAQAAARAGARAFVFVSSIKVNGEETHERPFRAEDAPHPADAYGRSKWEAEQALAELSRRTGLAVHVVRPTLVYGARAAGNLAALVRLCDSPLPLPLGGIANRRSFVAVEDLVALLLACSRQARAGELRTWIAAHPQAVSTSEVVAACRLALGRPRRLFAVPRAALEAIAAVAGHGAMARRLTRSLEADSAPAREALAWRPRVGIEEAMRSVVAASRGARA